MTAPTIWEFYSAGQLVFGRGSVERVAEYLQPYGWKKIFVVTDRNLDKLGLTDRALSSLSGPGFTVEIFRDGEAEPSMKTGEVACQQAVAFKPDVVIGFGGGSNMDVAKYVAAVVAHGGKPSDYFGINRVPGPITPLVCIPTTAGTGSEVSHAAVLTDTDKQIKVSSLTNFYRPRIAIVDPALTDGCPAKVTADSGIDALTHAIEGYTATAFDKLVPPDGKWAGYYGSFSLGCLMAEKGIQQVGQFLSRAVRDGSDREARDGMALAATLGGLAFSNCGVALVHALEYPIGAAVHCSHGAGNGLLLPYVMRYNMPTRVAEFARIATLLGASPQGRTEVDLAEEAVQQVVKLRREIGLPLSLKELGVTEEMIPSLAEKTFNIKRLMWINPRLPTIPDLESILRDAYHGVLEQDVGSESLAI